MQLVNVRGFSDITFHFADTGPTVFAGPNGAGKSTVLLGVSAFISWLAWAASNNAYVERQHVRAKDIRRGSLEALGDYSTLFGTATYSNQLRWKLEGDAVPAVDADIQGMEGLFRRLQQALPTDSGSAFPILMHLTPERFVGGSVAAVPHGIRYQRALVFHNAFDPRVGTIDAFTQWYRNEEDKENAQRLRDQSYEANPLLLPVRVAVQRVLKGLNPETEWGTPHAERDPVNRIVIAKGKQVFALDQLSAGEVALVLTAGEIARRLALANAHQHDPLAGCGIVLIDEVETHLHPKWQRRILPALQETFPNVQFIVTTHSPLVLSTVKPENIRVLSDFRLVERRPNTFGRSSDAILADVLDVPRHNEVIEARIEAIERHIAAGESDEAKAALGELAQDFGRADAEVQGLLALLEFSDLEDDAPDSEGR